MTTIRKQQNTYIALAVSALAAVSCLPGNALPAHSAIEPSHQLAVTKAGTKDDLHHQYIDSGRAKMEAGDYAGAIADFTEAIRLKPGCACGYKLRGDAHLALEEYQAALNDYTQAVRLDPDNAEFVMDRGTAYAFLSQLELAVQDFTRAISLDPTFAFAYWARGVLLAAMGQKQAAIRDLNTAASLFQEQGIPEGYQAVMALLAELQATA